MTAKIIRLQAEPTPEPVEEPAETPEPEEKEDDELGEEVRTLIDMFDHEIGRRFVSFPLRMQIERIELLIGDRGQPLG
jgi:hypothetical protein